MSQDFTAAMRRIDEIQEHLDSVFHRVNADPVYRTEEAIADAISDNPRYFDADRKAELAEIFFAVLDCVYECIVKDDRETVFCNPLSVSRARFPETEMLMRDMMPMAWALSACWNPRELKNYYCVYFQSITEEESAVLLECIEFLAGMFPEFAASPMYPDFHEFWDNMAHHRELLVPEDDEARSKLLTVLLEKKIASDRKRTGAQS